MSGSSEQPGRIIRSSVVYGPGNPLSMNIYRPIDAIYSRRLAMLGSGEAIKSGAHIRTIQPLERFLDRARAERRRRAQGAL